MSMYAWPFPSGMESYRLPLQYENGPAYPGGASLGLVADATPTPLTIEIAAIPHTVAALSRVAVPLSLVMGIPLAGVRVMGLGCRSAVATAVALVLGSGCWGTRQMVSSDTSPRHLTHVVRACNAVSVAPCASVLRLSVLRPASGSRQKWKSVYPRTRLHPIGRASCMLSRASCTAKRLRSRWRGYLMRTLLPGSPTSASPRSPAAPTPASRPNTRPGPAT